MTVRVDYDALVILRAAAALADLDGTAAQGLRRALALTDPVFLRALEAAEAAEEAESQIMPEIISGLVN